MTNQLDSLVPPRLVDPNAFGKQRPFVIYLRVSTEEQAQTNNSLAAQERECRQFADRQQGPVTAVRGDEGLSAYNEPLKRPGLLNAIGIASATGSDILVRDYSRLGRSADEMLLLHAELRAKGLEVISATEPFDLKTLIGRMMLSMQHFHNEMESEKIGDRTLSGMRQNFRTQDPKTGWYFKNGGSPPFGYKAHSVQAGCDKHGNPQYRYVYLLDDRLHQGKQVWEWLRYALIELRLKQGASYADVVKFFHSIQLPPPRNKEGFWHISTVQEICRWDRLIEYSGIGLFNRTAQGKSSRRRVGRREKPWEEVDWVENAHPDIISMEEAIALNRLTQSRQPRVGYTNRGARSPLLLTGGLSVCAECGRPVMAHGTKAARRYICGGYKESRGTMCTSKRSIRCELVDEPIVEYLAGRYATPAAIAQLQEGVDAAHRQAAGSRRDRRKEVALQIGRVDREVQRLLDAIKAGAPADLCAKDLQRLKGERDALEKEQKQLPERNQTAVPDVSKLLEGFPARFRAGRPEVRRRMVRAFIKQVEFDLEANEIRVHQYQRPELEALAASTQSQNWIQDGSGGWI
jgi:site-specific DNA recombinase